MKSKITLFLFIAIALVLSIPSSTAKNGTDKVHKRSALKTGKPKIEKQEFCYIRGFLQEVNESGTRYYVCYLVSTAKCLAIPCNVWGPYGPASAKAVESGPIPENLQIDNSKKYIVKFNQKGATEVQYVNDIKVEETSKSIIVHFN